MPPPPVLLVFSHLRWGFVYQRPQHLMSRMAGRWRVVFVEEPLHTDGRARMETKEVGDNLTVLTPHTPHMEPGFHDAQLSVLQSLLQEELKHRELQPSMAWLYTPMALPLAHALQVPSLVYDCMDELSAFHGAPRQLRQRESALLKTAALVLTGGPSLYEARKGLHPNIHCFRSAVDASHFQPAGLDPFSAEARNARRLQQSLPRPRLGFFGVIDERLDLELVEALADRHPEWSLVMVGPVVKIDPASLPQRPNLHWLGMQSYNSLPHLLADWDVALMPFAVNEATRFISPTKTLEYMAGQKPVVSSAIEDVRSLYASAVVIADTHEAFIAACEEVLKEDLKRRSERVLEMRRLVASCSWDESADAIHALMMRVLQPPSLSATPRLESSLPAAVNA